MSNTFTEYNKPSELKMAMDVMQANRQRDEMRRALDNAQRALTATVHNLAEAEKVEYTGWMGLFKQTGEKWECVATVDVSNLPDSWDVGCEPEWDMALPIPKPGTVNEFSGW